MFVILQTFLIYKNNVHFMFCDITNVIYTTTL